jgi:hypothetical protein
MWMIRLLDPHHPEENRLSTEIQCCSIFIPGLAPAAFYNKKSRALTTSGGLFYRRGMTQRGR